MENLSKMHNKEKKNSPEHFEPLDEVDVGRHRPIQITMTDEPRRNQEVNRAVTNNLISNV